MKKIMITGNKGFVGTHLTEHLEKNGNFEIISFDIKNAAFQDVRDENAVNEFMKEHKPDVVIHLAANPDIPTSVKYTQNDLTLNTAGTLAVLEASRKNNIKQFLFASTAQVYGEPQQRKMSEQHPLAPISPYAIGKLAAEQYIRFYHKKYSLPYVIFRFFNIYGEGQLEWTVVPSIIRRMHEAKEKEFKMYGSKEDSRDFIYIKDICRAFELAIEKKINGETINLGFGKETFILDLAKTMAFVLGKEFEYKYFGEVDTAKISRMEADVTKAKEVLGWEAKYSIKEGVTRFAKYKGYI